ncbi:zinc finger MYM-type protein 2-like [Dendronephthya gigantea]|uniref:zinc finger MYM-type protein 2-like n=1 Tax=Dendronephthya gigantea TaxID=151771 RepID=UPI0010691A38|nr:zinc finger MYM-type protein 2-like [Dendronephthya gigantea]
MSIAGERFSTLEKTIDEYIIDQENKNTRAKTKRDVNLLVEFLRQKDELRNPEELQVEELNDYLSEFILSVKKKDGEEYEPSSLRGFLSSFHRYLKEHKYTANIVEDLAFEKTRKCLQARSKQLKKKGKGNKPNAAEALTDDQINILYEKNLLGLSNNEALLNTLWLFNSLHFGLRGCDEHRQMCWGDVKLITAADGTEYLEYSERQTKTRTGAEPRNIRAVKPKAFAVPNGSRDRDPVEIYKTYCHKRPDAMNKPEAPFYLGINHIKNPSSGKSWFKTNAMGLTNSIV